MPLLLDKDYFWPVDICLFDAEFRTVQPKSQATCAKFKAEEAP